MDCNKSTKHILTKNLNVKGGVNIAGICGADRCCCNERERERGRLYTDLVLVLDLKWNARSLFSLNAIASFLLFNHASLGSDHKFERKFQLSDEFCKIVYNI